MMTKQRSRLYLWILLVTIIAMAAGICVHAETEPLDLSKSGSCSIRITLQDKSTGAAVSGGTLELIKVASVDSGSLSAFVPDGSFGQSDFDFDLSDEANLSSSDLAQKIRAYASKHGITGKQVTIGEDGTASFSGLDLGLYLVIDAEPAPGYTTAKPFLVTVPIRENEHYVYDVDASPKLEKVSPLSPVPAVCPEIRKVIKVPGKSKVSNVSKEYMSISDFTFSFSRMKDTYPMPVTTAESVELGGTLASETDDELLFELEGEGTIAVGTITFTETGDYYYTVKELSGDGNYTYDTTSYVLKYTVTREGDTLTVSDTQIRIGNANGERASEMAFTFNNTYRKGLVVNEEEEIEARKASLSVNEDGDSETPKKSGTTVQDEEGSSKKVSRTSTIVGDEQKVPKRTGNPTVEEDDEEPPRRTTTSEPSRVNLPQTGQLWWPVWILAALGAAFLLIGILRRFTSK